MPKSLLHLISSLIDGTYASNDYSQEVTVAQLITSHASRSRQMHVRSRQIPSVACRHSKNRETPIMLYNSLNIYMTNRSCKLLDHFFHLGICVSYDRVLEITKNIYENLRLPYFSHNRWFPDILRKVFLLY